MKKRLKTNLVIVAVAIVAVCLTYYLQDVKRKEALKNCKENCKAINGDQIQLRGYKAGYPLPKPTVYGMVEDFQHAYASVNSNIQSIPLKIKLTDLNPYINLGAQHANLDGLALHMMIAQYDPPSTQKYFSFALSGLKKTTMGNDSILPLSGQDYLYITNNGSLKNINSAQFLAMKGSYIADVLIHDAFPMQPFPILSAKTDSIRKITNPEHPKYYYFDQSYLKPFYDQNVDGRNGDQMYLYILNAAIFRDSLRFTPGNYVDLKIHTPILVFGESNKLYLDNKPLDYLHLYLNRGLDIGRACPPECGEQ